MNFYSIEFRGTYVIEKHNNFIACLYNFCDSIRGDVFYINRGKSFRDSPKINCKIINNRGEFDKVTIKQLAKVKEDKGE